MYKLFAIIDFFGGQYREELDETCTHLSLFKPTDSKDVAELKVKTQLKVVNHMWIRECYIKKDKLSEQEFDIEKMRDNQHPTFFVDSVINLINAEKRFSNEGGSVNAFQPSMEMNLSGNGEIEVFGPSKSSHSPIAEPFNISLSLGLSQNVEAGTGSSNQLIYLEEAPVASQKVSFYKDFAKESLTDAGDLLEELMKENDEQKLQLNSNKKSKKVVQVEQEKEEEKDGSESEEMPAPKEIEREFEKPSSFNEDYVFMAPDPTVLTSSVFSDTNVCFDLSGRKFSIVGYQSEPTILLKNLVQSHNGVVVFTSSSSIESSRSSSKELAQFFASDYLVVPSQEGQFFVEALARNKFIVSGHWIQYCSKKNALLPISSRAVFYPCKSIHKISSFKEYTVCLTGFVNDERQELIDMIQLMGAKYSSDLTPKTEMLVSMK